MTVSALRDASRLGFDRAAVVETIVGIERRMFVKSMTTFADPGVWQDVYYVPVRGLTLYVKFQGDVLQGEMIVAKDEKSLPETMVEPETGAILSRGVRPFTVTYKGESLTA